MIDNLGNILDVYYGVYIMSLLHVLPWGWVGGFSAFLGSCQRVPTFVLYVEPLLACIVQYYSYGCGRSGLLVIPVGVLSCMDWLDHSQSYAPVVGVLVGFHVVGLVGCSLLHYCVLRGGVPVIGSVCVCCVLVGCAMRVLAELLSFLDGVGGGAGTASSVVFGGWWAVVACYSQCLSWVLVGAGWLCLILISYLGGCTYKLQNIWEDRRWAIFMG